MADQNDKKTEEQSAAEKTAADKAAAEKAAADKAAAAKAVPKKADFVVAPDQAVITHDGRVIDAGGEVKPTDFHAKPAESKANFEDLVKRGAIVKGG